MQATVTLARSTDAGDVCFGAYRLSFRARRLTQDGTPVRLGHRAFDVLAILVAQTGRVVPKDEIMAQVWPDSLVEENTLNVHISGLRKLIGAASIATVSGRGYTFTIEVRPAVETAPPAPAVLAPVPRRGPPRVAWLAALAAIALAIVWGVSRPPTPPADRMTLRIEPFAAGGQPADADLAAQFTQAAIERLSQWEILTVSVSGTTQPAGAVIPRYSLRGTVHADATLATVVVQLTETRTGRLLYTTQIRRPVPASSPAIYGAAVVLLAGLPRHVRDAEFARYDGPPRDAADMVLRASAAMDGFAPAHERAALALGERALASEPDNPAAQYVMATLLYADFLASDARRGDAEGRRALALTDRLLARHPRNLVEQHLRAALLAALGDLRGAQAQAEAALEDEPDNPGMRDVLSAVLLREGDAPGSLRVLPHGGSGAADQPAVQAFAQGRYQDALEITQRNDAAGLPDPFEHVFRAATLARLGRLAEARAALATSLPLLPPDLRHVAALRQALFSLPAPAWAVFKDSLAAAGMPA